MGLNAVEQILLSLIHAVGEAGVCIDDNDCCEGFVTDFVIILCYQ